MRAKHWDTPLIISVGATKLNVMSTDHKQPQLTRGLHVDIQGETGLQKKKSLLTRVLQYKYKISSVYLRGVDQHIPSPVRAKRRITAAITNKARRLQNMQSLASY